MTWPQMLALAVGAIYLLIGIIGFFITGFENFFGNEAGTPHHVDANLLGFMINPFHNVVHIVIGLAGIALSRTLKNARTYGWLLAVGKEWDFLNLNWADNILHLLTAVVGLVIALGPVRTAVGGRTDRV